MTASALCSVYLSLTWFGFYSNSLLLKLNAFDSIAMELSMMLSFTKICLEKQGIFFLGWNHYSSKILGWHMIIIVHNFCYASFKVIAMWDISIAIIQDKRFSSKSSWFWMRNFLLRCTLFLNNIWLSGRHWCVLSISSNCSTREWGCDKMFLLQ